LAGLASSLGGGGGALCGLRGGAQLNMLKPNARTNKNCNIFFIYPPNTYRIKHLKIFFKA
jgi:hypothetical protein